MIEISGDVYLRCNKCGKIIRIDVEHSGFLENRTYERAPMDTRIYYTFKNDIYCDCGACISMEVLATEYPGGALEENPIVNIYGAEYYREPRVEIECFLEDENMTGRSYSNYIISPINIVRNMGNREFELFVGSIFANMGYEVTVTQRTRDGAFDFCAVERRNGVKNTIIGECKHYAPHRKVGDEIIRKIHDAQYEQHANIAMVVTSSTFTRDAVAKANQYGMTLWDINDLLHYGKDLI